MARRAGGAGAARLRPLPARSPHGGGGGSIFSRSRGPAAPGSLQPRPAERDPRDAPLAPRSSLPRAAMNEEYDVIVLGTGLTVRRSRRPPPDWASGLQRAAAALPGPAAPSPPPPPGASVPPYRPSRVSIPASPGRRCPFAHPSPDYHHLHPHPPPNPGPPVVCTPRRPPPASGAGSLRWMSGFVP